MLSKKITTFRDSGNGFARGDTDRPSYAEAVERAGDAVVSLTVPVTRPVSACLPDLSAVALAKVETAVGREGGATMSATATDRGRRTLPLMVVLQVRITAARAVRR